MISRFVSDCRSQGQIAVAVGSAARARSFADDGTRASLSKSLPMTARGIAQRRSARQQPHEGSDRLQPIGVPAPASPRSGARGPGWVTVRERAQRRKCDRRPARPRREIAAAGDRTGVRLPPAVRLVVPWSGLLAVARSRRRLLGSIGWRVVPRIGLGRGTGCWHVVPRLGLSHRTGSGLGRVFFHNCPLVSPEPDEQGPPVSRNWRPDA
jgi:hypothetical protein